MHNAELFSSFPQNACSLDIMSNILLLTRPRDKRLSSSPKHPDCGRIIYSQGGQKYPTQSKRKED